MNSTILLALTLMSPLALSAADPLTGTWVRNISLSTSMGATTKSHVLTFEMTPGGVRNKEVQTKVNGVVYESTWTAQPDGKAADVHWVTKNPTGKAYVPPVTVVVRKVDDYNWRFMYHWKDNTDLGEVVAISPDGKKMTITSTRKNANGEHLTYVYDKQ